MNICEQFERSQRITLHGIKLPINTVRWSPDGSMIASGGKDKILNVHRVKESEFVRDHQQTQHGHKGELTHICWNSDNPSILASVAADKNLKIWDLRFVEPITTIKTENHAVALSWSNSGSTIALGDKADVVSFVDIRNGWKLTNDQRHQYEICDLAWNKEGDLLHVVTGDGNMHIYSYPDLQCMMTCDAFATSCTCIRFDHSGQYFALGSNDAVSSVWEYKNIACMHTINRLDTPIHSVSFSYDDRYLATGSIKDRVIDIADSQTGSQIVYPDHPQSDRPNILPIELNYPAHCSSLDFHPKDYILAYAMNEKDDYREMGTIKVIGFPDRHSKIYG